MDIDKLESIYNTVSNILIENEATIDDAVSLGINLILAAWSTDPDCETLVDEYIECFTKNFRKRTDNLLKKTE